MKVTVTEQHLDKAIKALEAGKSYCRTCLVATAIQEATKKKVDCGGRTTTIDGQRFDLDSIGRSLVNEFDNEHFQSSLRPRAGMIKKFTPVPRNQGEGETRGLGDKQ